MSHPSTTTETEFEWRPTNTNYGRMSLCSDFWCLSGNDTIPPVPWSHGREEVPLWLSNQGVPLNAWQDWFDRATSLWMERNQSNLNTSKSRNCLFLLFPLIMILTFVSVALLPWESKIYGMAIIFPFTFMIMIVILVVSKKGQSNFLEIEAKWSDLIQDINRGVCKDLGIRAKAKQDQQHYYHSNSSDSHIHSSVYTVGLIFMIEPGRMHP
jgi:hypothetical protein